MRFHGNAVILIINGQIINPEEMPLIFLQGQPYVSFNIRDKGFALLWKVVRKYLIIAPTHLLSFTRKVVPKADPPQAEK
jgi:hypothetical protein